MNLGNKWTRTAGKGTASIPENWDTYKSDPSKVKNGSHVNWRVLVGGGDSEAGWTLVAAEVPDKYAREISVRVWFEVDYSEFPNGANNDQPKGVPGQIKKRGEEAADTFISCAKRIKENFEDSDERVDWGEAFKRALKDEELAPFVDKSGCDKLKWVPED